MKKIFTHWLPLVAWCSLIFYLSSIPNLKTEFGALDLVLRKCAHMTEYAVLFLLARRAARGSRPDLPGKTASLIALLFSVAYAASDEYHQSFVPTRGPSVYDVMIDTAGVMIGLALYGAWMKKGKETVRTLMRGAMKCALFAAAAGICVPFLSGCGGPQRELKKAGQLEEGSYYIEAAMQYEKVFKRYPASPAAPEALYRLGKLYQLRLKLFSQADHYYSAVIEKYPASAPWVSMAQEGLLTSPDYFPLSVKNFWIEGDSETGGRNMRAEWNCQAASSSTYSITRRICAGDRLVAQVKRYYRRQGLELRTFENDGAKYGVLISYPFIEGKSWKNTEGGRVMTNKIVSRIAAVKVKAGEFANCLKISESSADMPGSVKYNYYAPGVGWVLTTIAVAGGTEHHNTELLSYRIVPPGGVANATQK